VTDGNHGRALRRLLMVLRPYLPNLVLIGGWVPEMYRLYGGFTAWRTRLSGTEELDLLFAEIDDDAVRPPLATILETAGLHAEENTLGAVWVGVRESGEKLEFLVPHEGVMAAGASVAEQVENDIAAIAAMEHTRRSLRTATNHLSLLDARSPVLLEAASELAERDRVSERQAAQDLLGHIADLRDILEQYRDAD